MSTLRSRFIPSAFALACLAVVLIAAACESSSKAVQVTHYYKPGCAVCEEMKPAIAALAQEFPGRVEVSHVEATTDDARRDVQRLEFREEGLVVRDYRGAVIVKQADHGVNVEEVRTALAQYFEAQSGS
jgi:thiol-disulfide isomerase/thioredoxin